MENQPIAIAHSSCSILPALRSCLAISMTSRAWWNMLPQWQLAGCWSWTWNTGYDDGGGDSWELHGDTRLYRVRTKPLLQYFNQLAVCIRAFLGMRDQIPFGTRKSSTVKALILHDPYSFSKKETSLQFSSKSWGNRPMMPWSPNFFWSVP